MAQTATHSPGRRSAPPRPDSWTPVRNGNVYCSPACGHGCTHQAYLEATAQAHNLARLLGGGWHGVVSENLGWHYHAALHGYLITVYDTGRVAPSSQRYVCSAIIGVYQVTAYKRTARGAAADAARQLKLVGTMMQLAGMSMVKPTRKHK